MAKNLFTNPEFDGYYFDDSDQCVYSTKRPGAPVKLTWCKRGCGDRFVTLNTKNGYYSRKVRLSLIQVKANLKKAKPEVEAVEANSSLDVSPKGDFIAFSVAQRCSQYFSQGTTIQEALNIFAKRGFEIYPEDLRIMNPVTGEVRRLKAKVVTMYTLD